MHPKVQVSNNSNTHIHVYDCLAAINVLLFSLSMSNSLELLALILTQTEELLNEQVNFHADWCTERQVDLLTAVLGNRSKKQIQRYMQIFLIYHIFLHQNFKIYFSSPFFTVDPFNSLPFQLLLPASPNFKVFPFFFFQTNTMPKSFEVAFLQSFFARDRASSTVHILNNLTPNS